MTISITINDLNIPAAMKTDAGVIAEVAVILEDVKAIAFNGLNFTIDDTADDDVEEDFNRLVRQETEARFYYRNQPGSETPRFGVFFSYDAYRVWQKYYDPFVDR